MFKIDAPIYAPMNCIYPGPHLDDAGKIDPRTWFSIPIELSVEDNSITYLVFPYGGTDYEVKEVIIEAPASWTD